MYVLTQQTRNPIVNIYTIYIYILFALFSEIGEYFIFRRRKFYFLSNFNFKWKPLIFYCRFGFFNKKNTYVIFEKCFSVCDRWCCNGYIQYIPSEKIKGFNNRFLMLTCYKIKSGSNETFQFLDRKFTKRNKRVVNSILSTDRFRISISLPISLRLWAFFFLFLFFLFFYILFLYSNIKGFLAWISG